MMREIRFRGKTLNGKWVYGYPICSLYRAWIKDVEDKTTNPRQINSVNNTADFRCVEVDPETVGQYTESTDVNEKNIFDGDKVAFSVFDYNGNDTQYTGVVVFSDGHWQIWAAKDSPYYGSDGGFDLYCILAQDGTLEIIGNIHDKEVKP